MPPELVQSQPAEIEAFEVLPANWPAVLVFLDSETQWRCAAGMAGLIWIGLDYVAVDVVLRRTRREVEFSDLQVMEQAALDVFTEERP